MIDDALDPGPAPDYTANDLDRQAAATRAWWHELDDVARRRLLRVGTFDLLSEDLATGLALHGVTVIPAGPSPVDGRPDGWYPPKVLDDLLAELRRPGDWPAAGA